MMYTSATNFSQNLSNFLEQAIKHNEPITMRTKVGNAVVLSEADYLGLIETIQINSVPHMCEEIIEGINTPLSECLPESEIKW